VLSFVIVKYSFWKQLSEQLSNDSPTTLSPLCSLYAIGLSCNKRTLDTCSRSLTCAAGGISVQGGYLRFEHVCHWCSSCGVACVCKLCLFLPPVSVARVVVPCVDIVVCPPACLSLLFLCVLVYFWVCAWREDTVIQEDDGRLL
jgi:hypothetical protein